MKLIIAGSRSFHEAPTGIIDDALMAFHNLTLDKLLFPVPRYLPITEVVSGMAPGIDTVAISWANQSINYSWIPDIGQDPMLTKSWLAHIQANSITIKTFPADWKRYGSGAGYIRNTQMAHYADALLAIHDCRSPGTQHMIDTMISLGKPTIIYYPGNEDHIQVHHQDRLPVPEP